MENQSLDNVVHSNMCQCRCPCHFRDNPISTPSLLAHQQGSRNIGYIQQSTAEDDARNHSSHQSIIVNPTLHQAIPSSTHNADNVQSIGYLQLGTSNTNPGQNTTGSRNYRKSADIEPKFAVRPKPFRVAHNFSSFQITESESEFSEPYNPFRNSGSPPPAGAAISKSFLHAKNIVKHMKARWESLYEPVDGQTPTQRHSLTGRRMNYGNDSIDDGNDGTVDKGDQTKYGERHKSQVPKNIDEHLYSLEPLQSNRNLRTFNDPHSSSTHTSNIQINYTSSGLPQPVHSHVSSQQVSESVDSVSRQQGLDSYAPHSAKPVTQTPTERVSPRPVNTTVSHRTTKEVIKPESNSLHLLQSETRNTGKSFEEADKLQANVNSQPFHANSNIFHFENTSILQPFNTLASEGPHMTEMGKLPHSIESEVKHIRKSFEEEANQIVANANRRSYDATHGQEGVYLEGNFEMAKPLPMNPYSTQLTGKVGKSQPRLARSEVKNIRKSFEDEIGDIVGNVNRQKYNIDVPHATPSIAGVAVAKPSAFNTTYIAEEKSSVANTVNSKQREKVESIANNLISSQESRINEYKNGDLVFSAPTAHFESTKLSNATSAYQQPVIFEKDDGDDDDNSHFGKEKSTFSLYLENPQGSRVRGNSLPSQMPSATGNKSQTVAGCHYQDSQRRLSAPSQIDSDTIRWRDLQMDSRNGMSLNSANVSGASRRIAPEFPAALSSHSHPQHQHDEMANETGMEIHTSSHHNPDNRKPLSNFSSKLRPHVLLPKESIDGLVVVKHFNPTACYSKSENASKSRSNLSSSVEPIHVSKQFTEDVEKTDEAMLQSDHGRVASATLEPQDSTYVAWISVPNATESLDSKASVHVNQFQDSTFSVLDHMADVALEMYGPGIKQSSFGDSERVLATLSKDYDSVVATPSRLRIEPIGHSKSVTNTLAKLSSVRSSSHPVRQLIPSTTATTEMQSLNDVIASTLNPSESLSLNRRKMEFYICHKCHKVVESREAAFYCNGGFEFAWHPHCFKCNECDKDLSQTDHSFFEEGLYCLEHYVHVANIPKCFKCQERIFDSTYTSAAGASWHQQHFTCQACRRPLVDTKYVFVENKHPYCLHCHEKHFPKQCRTCIRQIASQEPYVQAGNSFWHSSSCCLHCSNCNHSLVGRTLFFRRGGKIFCNRYCALRNV